MTLYKNYVVCVVIALLSVFFLGSCLNPSKNKISNKSEDEALNIDSLVDVVQKQTFQYFWEGAEPNSGMARERIHLDGEYPQNDENVVTIGGSGFGLLAILIGIHNEFITREEGKARLQKMLGFLEKTERFEGVWSHWYEGETGKVKAFSEMDNGGDIVETAFMAQSLIVLREFYKSSSDSVESVLAGTADRLWREINWDFYRNGENVLYWHWSPTHGWGMNHAIKGYDECLISYVLAVSSPSHPVSAEVYENGWARNGAIKTSITKYDIPTEVKHNAKEGEIGPLFWAHYSYLALNPLGLRDKYVNYEKAVINHAKINLAYADRNPGKFEGYGSERGWGWTASYSINGYNAHHPDNDEFGVIAPTAAISSIAYTPEESKSFIKYLFSHLKNKLWGKYGFYDAYSESENWFPERYLAIDQGPIVVMIQNYKDAFVWDLFMKAPEVKEGLEVLGFQYRK